MSARLPSTPVLCLCEEPHHWWGGCVGPTTNIEAARKATLARLRTTLADPTEITDNGDGKPLPEPQTAYVIGEADMALFIAILKALAEVAPDGG